MFYGYFTADILTGASCAPHTGLYQAALQAFTGADSHVLRRTLSSFQPIATVRTLGTDKPRNGLSALPNTENKIQPINQILQL